MNIEFREKVKEFHLYNFLIRRPFKEKSSNINNSKQFAFIHIPKTAGSSMRKAFGLTGPGDHREPVYMMHPKTWEKYFTFCIVRNPWDRLLSSFRYHTSDKYASIKGQLFIENPLLSEMSFEDYFLKYKNYINLKPQVIFTKHKLSEKPINFVGRFEQIEADFNEICNRLQMDASLPRLNSSPTKIDYHQFYSSSFKNSVGDYYEEDIKAFNYNF